MLHRAIDRLPEKQRIAFTLNKASHHPLQLSLWHPTVSDSDSGFGHESPINIDRPWLNKWVGFWTKTTKIAICELRPVDIRIHDDIAIVQYFIFTIEKNDEGGKRVIRRYTMTWKKQASRWVVIGSHNNLMDETIRR